MDHGRRNGLSTLWPTRARRLAVMSVALLTGLLGASSAHAEGDGLLYNCILTGMQEVPPTATSALGGGQFRIDTDANTVTYHISFTGLTAAETAAHIHGYTDPGASAGVVTALPLGSPKSGVWSYPEVDEANILAGKAYVNIHSTTFPGGEIKGQIVPFNAAIDQAQEVPPTGSPGRGWAVFTIDTDLNELNYYVDFGGLVGTETGAHIHGKALHGGTGGVLHGLPLGRPKIGTWMYAESEEFAIVTGQTYVNIHSDTFPAGEIRGQIVPIVVPIDESQEIPPTGSPAAGIGLIGIDLNADALSYDIRFAGLTGAETAAHIHGFAPRGGIGGVLHGLPSGTPKIGVWDYDPADEPHIIGGRTYINIHSNTFPAGEIRGQIDGLFCPPTVAVSDGVGPRNLLLAQNAPNPFTSGTVIRFDLAEAMPVRLDIYDAQGRLVRRLVEEEMSAGSHPVAWDGRDHSGNPLASGIYMYVLETPNGSTARRLALLR